MTPPKASDPYKLDEAPFIISILSTEPNEILDKSNIPATLPIKGIPSINIKVYSGSIPCNCTPSMPPKPGTVTIPTCSLIISSNLECPEFSISFFEIILAGTVNSTKGFSVLFAETTTSSILIVLNESDSCAKTELLKTNNDIRVQNKEDVLRFNIFFCKND